MFEIFRDAAGYWCARRKDGLVCGTFRERADAGAEAEANLEVQKMLPRLQEVVLG